MKAICYMLFLLAAFTVKAQVNLVPNPSFEEYIDCPDNFNSVTASPDAFKTVNHWYSPSVNFIDPNMPDRVLVDYYNACAPNNLVSTPLNSWGFQWPRTGNAYMGFDLFVKYSLFPFEYREYIAAKLDRPLIKNFVYQAQFYVSSAENPGADPKQTADISSIGAYFSPIALQGFSTNSELPFVAQVQNPATVFLTDQQNWMEIKGAFKANGGERWINIGNFAPKYATPYRLRSADTLTIAHSHYYIDDVDVRLIQVNNDITDTSICAEGSILFPQIPYSDSCVWNDGQTALQRTFATTGKWWVTYYNIDGLYTATDTLNLAVRPPSGTKTDTAMCPGWTMLLTANPALAYVWDNGSTSAIMPVFTPGTYWVRRTLSTCFAIDTFIIRGLNCSLLPPNAIKDTAICSGGSIVFPPTAYSDSCLWNDGLKVKTRTFNSMGKWWITYYINGLPLTADTLNLLMLPPGGVKKDTVICPNQLIFLDAENASSYLWSTGATTAQIAVANAGIYRVQKKVGACLVIDTFEVRIVSFPTLPAIIDTFFCRTASVMIGHGPVKGYVFTWLPSAQNTPVLSVSQPGIYILQSDSAGCIAYDTVNVTLRENPVIKLVPDTVVCFADIKQVELDGGEFNSYLWQPTGETTRSIYATDAVIYQLTVTDRYGCKASQKVLVDEECASRLFFPNVFTPNNDGSNDLYAVGGTKTYTQAFSMQIYNRWGVKVYNSNNVYETWNGTMNNIPQPDDVYVLVASYRLSGKRYEVKMWVTLIR